MIKKSKLLEEIKRLNTELLLIKMQVKEILKNIKQEEKNMAKSQRMRNKKRDQKAFKTTANSIHKQNLDTTYSKGGIRL